MESYQIAGKTTSFNSPPKDLSPFKIERVQTLCGVFDLCDSSISLTYSIKVGKLSHQLQGKKQDMALTAFTWIRMR